MSGRSTGWVGQHGPHPDDVDRTGRSYGTRARGLRMVLLAVADAANVDGERAHPGVANVSAFSLYSPGQARRLLTELVEEGWLIVTDPGGGRGRAAEYALMTDPETNRHLQRRARRDPSEPRNARTAPPETRASEPDTRAPATETRASGRAPNGVATVGNGPDPTTASGEPRLALVPDPAPAPEPEQPARRIAREVWEAKSPRPATPFMGVVKVAEALLNAGHEPDRVRESMLAVPTISIRWCEGWLNGAATARHPAGHKVTTARDASEGVVDL